MSAPQATANLHHIDEDSNFILHRLAARKAEAEEKTRIDNERHHMLHNMCLQITEAYKSLGFNCTVGEMEDRRTLTIRVNDVCHMTITSDSQDRFTAIAARNPKCPLTDIALDQLADAILDNVKPA